MLTIRDTIRYHETMAEEFEQKADADMKDTSHLVAEADRIEYRNEVKKHRLYASWLRELIAYRDGCHCDTCRYKDTLNEEFPCCYCEPKDSRWEFKR